MPPAGDRVRVLLLRGDNLLKSAAPERYERALASFVSARDVAADPSVEPRLRELIDRRIEELERRIRERA